MSELTGRELDAAVAEEVMGATVHRWNDGRVYAVVLNGGSIDLPRYSTDIATAWQVVERLGLSVVRSEDGWYSLHPEDIEHGCVRGTSFPTLTLVGAEGQEFEAYETAPEAICRAALAAVRATTAPASPAAP